MLAKSSDPQPPDGPDASALDAPAGDLSSAPSRRVFISHSTADRATVELIVERLTAHGIEVWVSHRHIDGQSEYSTQIDAAIGDCVAVLVVISRSSNASAEVLKEVELALKRNRVVFPVLIDPGEQPRAGLAYHLAAQNWLAWFKSPQSVVDQIRETIEALDPSAVDADREARPYLAYTMAIGTHETPPAAHPGESAPSGDRARPGMATSPPGARATVTLPRSQVGLPPLAPGSRPTIADREVASPLHDALPSGTMLGRYRLIHAIARTNTSIGYRAENVIDGQTYFVKEFFPRTLAKGRKSKRSRIEWDYDGFFGYKTQAIKRRRDNFCAEGRTLELIAKAGAPFHAATLYANGTAYLVTEFIPGETWASYLDRYSVVTWREVYELLLAILPGVERCHELGVIHCDIQPTNIVISSARPPVVVDFGSAVAWRSGSGSQLAARAITPGFSAPELVTPSRAPGRDGRIGPWTDLFSIGAVAFVSLTSRLPQIGGIGVEVNELTAKRGAPPQLAAAIGWCLAIAPDHRPRCVRDVTNLLRSIP